MKMGKTYTYRQAGQQEGPYFESQIISMVNSGIIRADAVIQCDQDKADRSLRAFLVSRDTDLNDPVIIVDVKMPFDSVLRLALQWTIGALLIGAALGVAYFLLSRVFA
jgi:hypothetical protein